MTKNLMKQNIREIAFAAASTVFVATAFAAPSLPGIVNYRQPDGKMTQVVLRGDEHCHWYETPDGTMLMPDAQGGLVTADSKWHTRIARQRETAVARASSYTTFPTTGRQKALVILVQYTDRAFTYGHDEFNDMLNKPGYSNLGAAGSAYDYFIENSAGQFAPEFDVYGPVTLDHEISYYGANDDALAHEMVAEACRKLDNEIDFSQYDRDNDGWVDNVYIFYAGYGEADGGGVNSVWPHSANAFSKGVRLNPDGVQIGHYACSNELVGNTQRMVGIGTFCHEFSHVLGLPDLYSTNGNDAFTPYYYSLMDHGNYNRDGRCPCALTAYERYFLGWNDPTIINGEGTLRIASIDSNMAYRVNIPGADEEYYLLENRQQSGWDAALPGHGLLIWHIDYNKGVWDNNAVNNDSKRQRVDLIEADQQEDLDSSAGDPFPGSKNVTSFSGFRGRNAGLLDYTISNIREKDNAVILDFGASSELPQTPATLDAEDVDDNFFTARWQEVEGAEGYVVNVYAYKDGRIRNLPEYTLLQTAETSLLVKGLEPQTQYEYTVAARRGMSIGAFSAPAAVTTAEPGIAYSTVEALEATNITDGSFTANWNPLELAESYAIDVFRMTDVNADADIAAFSSPLELPEGWSGTASGTMSVNGYFGAEAPSLRFSQNAEVLQSPEYDKDIESLSFWMRGYKADAAASLTVSVLDNGVWRVLDEIKPIDNSAGKTMTYDAAALGQSRAVKLQYSMPSGNGSVCVDDVTIGFGTVAQREYITNKADVGTGTSASFDGLQPLTQYSYIVYGKRGDRYSLPSETINVTTSPGGGVDGTHTDVTLRAEGNRLVFDIPTGNNLAIYTLAGICTATFDRSGETVLPTGIYIVYTGGKAYKVTIK